MLNYKNDQWLLRKEITINDLIKNNQENIIFLNRKEKILNLFLAFVKKEDFIKQDKINQPLQKTVYVKISEKLTNILDKYFSDKQEIINLLENYSCRRSNLKKAIKKWFKNRIFPFVLLRILSKDEKEFLKFLKEIEYFTDFLNKSRFNCPKILNYLLDKKIVYLIGCSVGDGNIDKAGKRWTLVDGHSKKEKVVFSKIFVSNLMVLLKNFINQCEIRECETKYVLRVNNKLFCRFLNFFFGLPFGRKKDIILTKPFILNFNKNDLEKYFWRGCFDTDGGINKQGAIELCSSDNNLLNECDKYLRFIGMNPKRRRHSSVIRAQDLKKFTYIGFSHPRKQKEFLDILKRNSKYTCVKIKNNEKIDRRLSAIYNLIRIDKNYRIRIHSKNLKESQFNEKKIKQIIKELFGYELKTTSKNLLYFKSKKVYDYLKRYFVFEPYWKSIKREERYKLLKEWNEVWN